MVRRLPLMFLVALAGLFGLVGATPGAPVPTHLMPKTPPFTHPTAVGTEWVYEISGSEQTIRITDVETKGTAKLITLQNIDATGKATPSQKLLIARNEWFLAEESGHLYDPPWCLVVLPDEKERKWEFSVSRPDITGAITGKSLQPAATERLKTPAGTFDAVKVDKTYAIGKGGETRTVKWYANGVGLLQMDRAETLVLKKLTPGKE